MINKEKFPATIDSVPQAVEFISEQLKKLKTTDEDRIKAELKSEELIVKLIEMKYEKTVDYSVSVHNIMGKVSIGMSCGGNRFGLQDIESEFEEFYGEDENANAVVKNLISNVLGNDISVGHMNGLNRCTINITSFKYMQLLLTIGALILGVLAGFILKAALPESACAFVASDIFGTITTIFMNALKMVIAPLVFCSIAASMADFGDLKALGKLAGRVVGFYTITSVMACLAGLGASYLLPCGNPDLMKTVTAAVDTSASNGGVWDMLRDTIVGIVPKNIINPFLNMDMLQIIFLAIIVGIASATVGEKYWGLRDGINNLNAAFSKITSMIVNFMPLVIFSSMAKMVMDIDVKSIISVFTIIPTAYLAMAIMICVYALLLLLIGRENPFRFFKNVGPVMLTAASLCSSSATMPLTLETCEKKLGIPKKIYSFSIPLGTTINMDGGCIAILCYCLFFARSFGVELSGVLLFKLLLSIVLISLGCPAVPGAGMLCVAMLLPQIGVPAEAVSLIMGINLLIDMGDTLCNVTGDMVVSKIVSKMKL